MGISLFGLTPAATYPALIKFGDNSAISGVLRALSDGLGNDLPIQVSNTAVNFTGTLTQAGATLQPTLVSGTNIKTVNGASVLGSGNIVTPQPSGVAGAIQFSNGSAFASDAANFFWDDTNKRLGIGTNNPYAATLQVKGINTSVGTNAVFVENSVGLPALIVRNNGTVNLPGNLFAEADISVGNGNTSLGARLGIKGSGSTSATTSLLVQNSAGTEAFRVYDNGIVSVGGTFPFGGYQLVASGSILAQTGLTTNGLVGCDRIGIGETGGVSPVASAALEVRSTTKGILFPRMTTTERNAIATPATGLQIYNSTTNTNDTYNGTAWQSNSVSGVSGAIQFSNGSAFASDASNFFWDNTNKRLGIGTNSPTALVHIAGNWQSPSLVRQWFKLTETSTGNTFGIVPSQVGLSNTGYSFQINEANEIVGRVGQTLFGTLLTGGEMTARVGIRGNGSTSATTSLLVQNSGGSELLKVDDSGQVYVNTQIFAKNTAFGAWAQINTFNNNLSLVGYANASQDHVWQSSVSFNSSNFRQTANGFGFEIGNLPTINASAIVNITSTTKGFLPPRMTTTQKNAIATPAAGLVVYDNTTNKLNYNNGTVWKEVTPDGYTGLVTVNATPPVTFDIQNGIIVNVI
jgi:hypothetical protein